MDNHGGIKVSDFSEAVKELVADKGISEELVLKTIEMADYAMPCQ